MRRRSRAGVLLMLALFMLGSALVVPTAVATASAGVVLRDITYCLDDGAPQRLDLYQPTNAAPPPHPVVVWIHGGTWVEGSKAGAAFDPVVGMLRASGITVAAVDYSLAPAHPFPAQIQDLTCAVRALRTHASKYGLDVRHVGALGMSAGGHLAAMLGVQTGGPMFVGGGFPGRSSHVQAVAALYGVHDLTLHDLARSDERRLPSIFGKPKAWASASPISYVRAGLPPFLLVHGNLDADVPIVQSRDMRRALHAAGDSAALIAVRGAGHNLTPVAGAITPSMKTIRRAIVDFFVAKLGG
jgi:acetyl esterase/lipase